MELSQNCNAEAQKIIATQTGNQTFYDLMASLEPSKSIIFNITGNDRENLQTKFPLVFTERRHLEFFDLPIVNPVVPEEIQTKHIAFNLLLPIDEAKYERLSLFTPYNSSFSLIDIFRRISSKYLGDLPIDLVISCGSSTTQFYNIVDPELFGSAPMVISNIQSVETYIPQILSQINENASAIFISSAGNLADITLKNINYNVIIFSNGLMQLISDADYYHIDDTPKLIIDINDFP